MNTDKSTLKELRIGEKTAQIPIIQGGMGVGISRSRLAGAVAREGGVGVISTAQIGYDEEGFEQDQARCNRMAIEKHVKKAKEIAGGRGLVAVNIMVALKHYEEHVRESVKAGADVIISGAGLPMDLPKLVSEESGTKIAPIVSSRRAANLILKMWAHRYDRTADFIVIEGPKAGGHLGFSREQLADINALDFDEEICRIIECKKEYEEKFDRKIPVIVAGGVFDRAWDLAQMVCRSQVDLWRQRSVMLLTRTREPTLRRRNLISRSYRARWECRDVRFEMNLSGIWRQEESRSVNATIVWKNVTRAKSRTALQKH